MKCIAALPAISEDDNAKRPSRRKPRAKTRQPAVGPQLVLDVPEAPFAAIGVEPVDTPSWPIQPAGWFQPEPTPAVPAWSGIGIERHSRTPLPGFIRHDISAVNRADALEVLCESFSPNAVPNLPESGLDPLGWDPRTEYRKEAGK